MMIWGIASEQQQIKSLVVLAKTEGFVSEEDTNLLLQAASIDTQSLPSDQNIKRLKRSLPRDRFKKFKLIYILTRKLIRRNALSEKVSQILQLVLNVLNMSVQRTAELIEYLKASILTGHTIDQSYNRLGYLVP